ncbi:substrate-binding domain-containing protein [Bengtsoniella intestinalis]|uniref:substrate-binding domain-containing protein n=1 Tax=Bengtsoniella intestinalis TaxID=3073143 RepID=UPI00391FB6AE
MLKKILVILCVVGVIATAHFAANNQTSQQYRLMFIPKSSLSTFWQIAIEGFETAVAEYNVYGEVRNTDSEEDIDGQIAIVRQAIAEDFDAIIISSNSYEDLAEPVREAMDAGLEVVVFDSDVNVPEVKVRVSTDNYVAGFQMGEKMAEMLGYQGDITVISFDTVTQNGNDRVNGFYDAIAQYDGVVVLADEMIPSVPSLCQEVTVQMIETYPTLAGIATFNELTTVGMCAALEALDRTDLICVGFDNNTQVLDYLERGIIDVTIVQNQFAMGYLGAEYAIQLLSGTRLEDVSIDTGTHVVTRENMFELQTALFPFYADS